MARILSRSDIQRCLTMPEAINAMRLAFRALHAGQAMMPQRTAINLPEQGTMLLMPSLLATMEQQDFGLKLVAVMPRNPVRNLPLIYASVLLVDATTGRTLAIMEGGWLTAMRTGAVSGLATDLLARPDADVLTLFGAGTQAPLQALAIHTVRPLREHHWWHARRRLRSHFFPGKTWNQGRISTPSVLSLPRCAKWTPKRWLMHTLWLTSVKLP